MYSKRREGFSMFVLVIAANGNSQVGSHFLFITAAFLPYFYRPFCNSCSFKVVILPQPLPVDYKI